MALQQKGHPQKQHFYGPPNGRGPLLTACYVMSWLSKHRTNKIRNPPEWLRSISPPPRPSLRVAFLAPWSGWARRALAAGAELCGAVRQLQPAGLGALSLDRPDPCQGMQGSEWVPLGFPVKSPRKGYKKGRPIVWMDAKSRNRTT